MGSGKILESAGNLSSPSYQNNMNKNDRQLLGGFYKETRWFELRNQTCRVLFEENLLLSAHTTWNWGAHSFALQHDNDLQQTAKTTLEWLSAKSPNVLECPGQSPDLEPTEHLRRELRTAFDLMELDGKCQEEWDKLPKSRCSKVVETYQRRV